MSYNYIQSGTNANVMPQFQAGGTIDLVPDTNQSLGDSETGTYTVQWADEVTFTNLNYVNFSAQYNATGYTLPIQNQIPNLTISAKEYAFAEAEVQNTTNISKVTYNCFLNSGNLTILTFDYQPDNGPNISLELLFGELSVTLEKENSNAQTDYIGQLLSAAPTKK